MSKKFIIIDGYSLIHKNYYSSLPLEIRDLSKGEQEREYWRLNRADGHYINAIDGFVADLISYKFYQKADYIAVCFDEDREKTFRREIYPAYKAQRSKTPFPLEDQMKYAAQLCRELGIPVFSDPRYEADDFAGTIAKKFASEDVLVDLVTTDRDYFQLVDTNISCCLMCQKDRYVKLSEKYGRHGEPLGCIRFNKYMVKNETGVWPDQVSDWKAVSGDASDNIPGIRGVSDKTTIPLLEKYHSLNGIFRAIRETPETSLKKIWKEELGINRPPVTAFKDPRNYAHFWKQLATIRTDLSVPDDIGYYRYILDFDQMIAVLDRLGLIKPVDLLEKLAEKGTREADLRIGKDLEMDEEMEDFDAFAELE